MPTLKVLEVGIVNSSLPICSADEPKALTSGSMPDYLVITNTLSAWTYNFRLETPIFFVSAGLIV